MLKYEKGSLVSTLQSFVEKKGESFTFMFKDTLFFSVDIGSFILEKENNIVYTNLRIPVPRNKAHCRCNFFRKKIYVNSKQSVLNVTDISILTSLKFVFSVF